MRRATTTHGRPCAQRMSHHSALCSDGERRRHLAEARLDDGGGGITRRRHICRDAQPTPSHEAVGAREYRVEATEAKGMRRNGGGGGGGGGWRKTPYSLYMPSFKSMRPSMTDSSSQRCSTRLLSSAAMSGDSAMNVSAYS
jgi:hypothetical protein